MPISKSRWHEAREFTDRALEQGLIPDHLVDDVKDGLILVEPGADPNKPVLRDAATQKLVPGTGQLPGAPNIGELSAKYAWKRSKEYTTAREAYDNLLRRAIPAEEDPELEQSFGWLLHQGLQAAEGTDVTKVATCPDCKSKFEVVMYKRPDTKFISYLIDQLIGRSRETSDINVRMEQVFELLMETRDAPDVIDVQPGLTEGEIERRRRALDSGE